jgi:hypothetical protein
LYLHIFWTLKFANNLNIIIRMWEKYFGLFMSLSIYIFQAFILNFFLKKRKLKLQKNPNYFPPFYLLFLVTCKKSNQNII